jgi:hypothetical protein
MTPVFLLLLLAVAIAIFLRRVEPFSQVKPLLQPDSGLVSAPWTVYLKEGEDSWHQPMTPGVQWLSRFIDS